MNTKPWDYWTADKKPNARIAEAVRLVETVLARSARHPQAAHLYIHLMRQPQRIRRTTTSRCSLAKQS